MVDPKAFDGGRDGGDRMGYLSVNTVSVHVCMLLRRAFSMSPSATLRAGVAPPSSNSFSATAACGNNAEAAAVLNTHRCAGHTQGECNAHPRVRAPGTVRHEQVDLLASWEGSARTRGTWGGEERRGIM